MSEEDQQKIGDLGEKKDATQDDVRYETWSRFFEPALILTLMAFAIYIIWVVDCYRYFSILAFPYQFANIQNGFVMPRIILYLLLTDILYFILLYISFFYIEPRFTKSVGNVIASIIYLSFFYIAIFGPWFSILDQSVEPISMGIVGCVIGLLSKEIYMIILNKKMSNFINRFFQKIKPMFEDRDNMIVLITLFFLLNSFFPSQLAWHDATALVEGHAGSREINFDLNESIMNLSKNNTFILIAIQDGNYYFVEKCIPAPLVSPVYAVPINKVNAVKITNTESKNQSIFSLPSFHFPSIIDWLKNRTQINASLRA